MPLDPISVVITSVGTEQQAVEISEELVARRLATCVNILPCHRSIYRWKGKVCEDTEYLLMIKAPADRFDGIAATIRELHSYELPEIMALPVERAEAAFHEWVIRMVSATDDDGPPEDAP